jgi:putative endonuclease
MAHRYFVYVLTNRHHTALYVGVTNMVRRVHEHRTKIASGFTTRYNVDKLVYFEETSDVVGAIAREKQIKGGLTREEDCAGQRHESRLARSVRRSDLTLLLHDL